MKLDPHEKGSYRSTKKDIIVLPKLGSITKAENFILKYFLHLLFHLMLFSLSHLMF